MKDGRKEEEEEGEEEDDRSYRPTGPQSWTRQTKQEFVPSRLTHCTDLCGQ